MDDGGIEQFIRLAGSPLSILVWKVGARKMSSNSSDCKVGVGTAICIETVAEVHVFDEPDRALSLPDKLSLSRN